MGRCDFPPSVQWLAGYRIGWFAGDILAGITLTTYAIPVSLACSYLSASGKHVVSKDDLIAAIWEGASSRTRR